MAEQTNMDAVFAAIKREREYQDRKWGSISDNPHPIGMWLILMLEEIEEANYSPTPQDALKELLQAVALGVAALEQHGIVER